MVTDRLSRKPGIDFIVAGGAGIGLGHVMRSAVLASQALRRGWRVRCFLEGDDVAAARWKMACGQTRVWRWDDWNPLDTRPWTLFDHPNEKSSWLSRVRRSNSRAIVLDDPRYVREAALSICPALHHPRREESDVEGAELLSGPRFAILADVHKSLTRHPLMTRTRLLLSMGGSDPHQITPRIAPLLVSVLQDSDVLHGIESWHVVLGPAFDDPGGYTRLSLRRSGWRVHSALDARRMASLMSKARIAVMGFGTSLTELAWHGTPHLSVTHHPEDEFSARSLESQGIGIHLGFAETLDDETTTARFRRALEDTAWQKTSSERAFRAIEGGRGSERILDRLDQITRRSASDPMRVRPPGESHVPSN